MRSSHPREPPFTLPELTAAARLAFDEPERSDVIATLGRIYEAYEELPSDPRAAQAAQGISWMVPEELLAALTVAIPEATLRVHAFVTARGMTPESGAWKTAVARAAERKHNGA